MFLGLDLSLDSSGYSLIDEEYKIHELEIFHSTAKEIERLYFLDIALQKFLDNYTNKIILVCIESPAFRESGRLFQLGEFAGIVKLNLFKRGIPFILAAPLQLKKYVSGRGESAGKQTVILDVYKQWKEEIRQDDKADAYVLSRMAHDYHFKYIEARDVDLKEYQKDVLSKLHKSFGQIKKGNLLD
jgi:crossover junction endodeoxyribonuclease RuvC